MSFIGQITNNGDVSEDYEMNNNLKPLKLEFPPTIDNIARKNESNPSKIVENEKYDTLNNTPLAVPMIADTYQKSVTRNDAKIITETRLKKLKALSQKPEEQLSQDQKAAKKRIIRLEKNRRAAAMSRRKKKMYVKNLENKYGLMERHLAILQMENAQLKSLLNSRTNIPQIHISNTIPPNIPQFAMPQNIPHFQIPQNNNNSWQMPCNINSEVPQTQLKSTEEKESSMTPSISCDNSSEMSLLEPPLPIDTIDMDCWF